MPSSLPRPFSIPAAIFAGGLGILWVACGSLLPAAETPLLRVAFETGRVMISGRVDTEATAETIVKALHNARPDLAADRSGLVVDPSAPLPDLTEFPSLLAELGLSTHEGQLELWPDRLVIGGLTDSLVTQSALRIRAEPFLKGRILQNRLCIVGTEDLPKLEVSLAGANAAMPQAAPAVVPVAAPVGSFEMPGLSFAKLLAVMRLPGQIDRLSGKATSPAAPMPAGGALRAEPLPATTPSNAADAPPAPTMPLTATPVQTFETLSSVLFSRNSFLLQANQQATIEGITKLLLSPARRGAPVRIEAVKPSGGSTAFNEYLCERRAAEVARFLTDAGVAASLLRVKTIESSSPVDGGEVRLFVEILPPVEPPAPSATAADGSPSNPSPADSTSPSQSSPPAPAPTAAP
jgi:outer membrane protein OmpA-like peptidoglycan-associated protein